MRPKPFKIAACYRSTRGICHFRYVVTQLAGFVIEEQQSLGLPCFKMKWNSSKTLIVGSVFLCLFLFSLSCLVWNSIHCIITPWTCLCSEASGLKLVTYLIWFLWTESLGAATGVWECPLCGFRIKSMFFCQLFVVVATSHHTMTCCTLEPLICNDESQGLFKCSTCWIIQQCLKPPPLSKTNNDWLGVWGC